MDIEIITTKKKLTKSILEQMPSGETTPILSNCEVLGYLLGVVKYNHKAVLIKSETDYYILNTSWKKSDAVIYRSIGSSMGTKIFNSECECNIFWDLLQEVISRAVKHIYI